MTIELIPPGERRGRRAIIALERCNQLASGEDMNTILMNAVAGSAQQRAGGQVVALRGRRLRGVTCPQYSAQSLRLSIMKRGGAYCRW